MNHSTKYLQDLIDNGGGRVFFPDGFFEIDEPLTIGDNTQLICSPRTYIKLADKANCPILMNKWKGNEVVTKNILIEGGIWDGNNIGQEREKYTLPVYYHWGQMMCFAYVENLTIRSLTVKDPNSYGIMLTDVRYFNVEDIFFDFNMSKLNMDGLHINGWAKDGHIHNLKGSTNDDLVALNSDEGNEYSDNCDIENIMIDGLYGGDNGYTAVRLLSRRASVKNIIIRNISGNFRYHIVLFSHWAKDRNELYGHFDNVLVENVVAGNCCDSDWHNGMISFQDDVADAGHVYIRNFCRLDGKDTKNCVNTVHVGKNVKIESLSINDIHQTVNDSKPLLDIDESAEIGCFILNGNRIEQSGKA